MLKHACNHMTFRDGAICEQDQSPVASVSVDADGGQEPMLTSRDFDSVPGRGG